MTNLTLNILFILLAVLGVAGIYALFVVWQMSKAKSTRVNALKEKYETNIAELKSEIKRQNYVLNDYQRKLHNKSGETQHAPVESVAPIVQSTENIEDLLHEKRELEKEKQQFQEKTKKLWEQSLAIHKEKERIDGMRKEIEVSHRHVTDSIHYAKNIQQALLPPDEYLTQILPDYFIFYKPRDIVSGDFYWVNTRNQYVYLVAADCTGHGVPGAFMSMLGISFLNEIVNRQETPNAADILEKMRAKVIDSLHQDGSFNSSKDGMDVALCIIDTQKLELQYAGAYNSLLFVRDGELTEYKATKAPVAYYFEDAPFENNNISYRPGDCIYIFSDGFSDQFGGKEGRKFQMKNFRKKLTDLSVSNMSMTEIGEALNSTFNDWKGERQKQIDDVLVIGVRL